MGAPAADPMKDFFISYNKADRSWAEWIAWELEEVGYSVVIQAWDFGPGSNFVLKMDEALKEAERMIAVLSPDYVASRFTAPEWAAVFAGDSTGGDRKLVPVRVREVDLSGLLAQIVYADLVGTHNEAASRTLLLDAVQRGRAKPKQKPAFPGAPTRTVPEQPHFPGALPAIWNVPHNRNRNFTGRADLLSTLRAQLQEGHHSALTALHGLGGIGKTQTALEYAYRYAGEYTLVWWLRSEDPATLAGDYALLAAKLGLAEAAADQQAAIQAVKEWLGKSAGWLLAFDNAREPEEIRPYLPAAASGHVIITSRRPDWRSVADPLSVSTLAPEDAVDFLHHRSGRQDANVAWALVEELGYLPLAIEQAAAYIDEHGGSIADYLNLFRKHRQQILRRGRPSSAYPDTVETTWELSIEKVREQSQAAADLLKLCAFLAPDDIPLKVIRDGRELLPGPLTTTAGNELELDDAISSLRRHSLVERTEGGISVHRLVQAVVRERMETNDRKGWAQSAAGIILKAFPNDGDNVDTWPSCMRLLTHATAAASHCESEEVGFVYAIDLLSQSALYLYARADFISAKTSNERALKLSEETFGQDHPEVAVSINNLGLVLKTLGHLDQARELYKRALAIDEVAYGPDHPETATDLNNLATLLHDLGDLTQARLLLERALSIYQTFYGSDDPHVAIASNNLGTVLIDLGELSEARHLLKRALDIDAAVYGPDHPKVAIRMNSHGRLMHRLGDLSEARKLLERALFIDEASYSSRHPNLIKDIRNLASVLQDMGDFTKARELYERALIIAESSFGSQHATTAMVRENLRSLEDRKIP